VSNQADIRDIQILGDLKTAFGRFGEDVLQVLAALEKQFEEIQEQLEQRQEHWQRQVDAAQEAVYEARRSLNECESEPDDEEGNSPDCSSEAEQVSDAERDLAVYEENLEIVKQWRHHIESQIADFQNDIHRLSDLASTRTGSAQAYLANKIEILDRYVGGISSTIASVGLRNHNPNDKIVSDAGTASTPAKMRDIIRDAHYVSSQPLGGGINQTIILKNGVKVVFKPVDGEYQFAVKPGVQPGTQYSREKAASALDELLGLGLVPPTEIITYSGRVGSAQLFQEGFETAWRLAEKRIITTPVFERLTNRQRQDWQLLDEVLGSLDRHSNNYMLRNRPDGGFDVALIDNGYCLSETGYTDMQAQPASQQKIDTVNRSRLEHFLNTEVIWRPRFQALIGDAAVDHMTERARDLLKRGYYE
jgi:prefoldin subunit 5